MTPPIAEALERPAVEAAPPLPRKEAKRWGSAAFCFACFVSLLAFVYLGHDSMLSPIFELIEEHRWLRILEKPSILWAAATTLLLYLKTWLWFRYKPYRVLSPEEAPPISVIIPAYNEGALVLRTIESVARARYPRERLEVFVVDDGSKDDTWDYIQQAVERHPGLITAARFVKNQGKRAALAYAFRRAKGDVFVTIDSDSLIEPDALLAMAAPFEDQTVGAAAGQLLALNKDESVIPQMLHVYYLFTSDLLRAFQSTYRTVACCPGALAAYRACIIRKICDEWETQTFLGRPVKNGEDRALTNLVFREGYDAVYQRAAAVHTMVPTTYKGVCKMYLRWDRGTIREEFLFAKLIWKRPAKVRLLTLFFWLMRNLCYPVGYAGLLLLGYLAFSKPIMLFHMLVGITLMSLFDMLFYLNSDMSWRFLYGVLYSYFNLLGLIWIYPYAFFTVRRSSWMTR